MLFTRALGSSGPRESCIDAALRGATRGTAIEREALWAKLTGRYDGKKLLKKVAGWVPEGGLAQVWRDQSLPVWRYRQSGQSGESQSGQSGNVELARLDSLPESQASQTAPDWRPDVQADRDQQPD